MQSKIAEKTQPELKKPLKASLFPYLPAVYSKNPHKEYAKLAKLIDQKLKLKNINVQVQICDPFGQGSSIFDQNKINEFFQKFDIMEIDLSYLWAVKKQLLQFDKTDISYYEDAFDFQWQYLTRDGKLIGSPGLLCSYFLQSRNGTNFKDRLYADFSDRYLLVSLYLNFYINENPQRSLENIDFTVIDLRTLQKVAEFLKNCQEDNTKFDPDQNWCFESKGNFFETSFSTTVGFCQNLFNFQISRIPKQQTSIKHLLDGQLKKIFYADAFIAKVQSDKSTVLRFYEFMISDQILDIYINGLYTDSPNTCTYLLPPMKNYFAKLVEKDVLYQVIYKSAFENSKIQIYCHQDIATNRKGLADKIKDALQTYRIDRKQKSVQKSQSIQTTDSWKKSSINEEDIQNICTSPFNHQKVVQQ